jgi:hypothetical protein
VTDGPVGASDSSRVQLVAIVLVTLLVMVLGVLVVVAPERMGVPRPPASPAVTPVATVSP